MYKLLEVQSYRGKYSVSFVGTVTGLSKIEGDCFLLIDKNVNSLYPEFSNSFQNRVIEIYPDERSKSLGYCAEIIDRLIEMGIKKSSKIVAVGGGITQDISGFISSIIYRGIDWVFFPTTLLAQADSCIGSKTSINFDGAKNLLGTFYPPSQIYCCLEFLHTLDAEDIKSGIGEIIHYYIPENLTYVEALMANYKKILQHPTRPHLIPHVYRSLQIKKKMVELDEFDSGPRRLFNYGHTFGHAIETVSDFKIPHGQAVTMGIGLANYVSWKKGLLYPQQKNLIQKLIEENMPDFLIDETNVDDFMTALKKDKKNGPGNITCILLDCTFRLQQFIIEDIDGLRTIILAYFDKRKT